jgi:hypothetical protein
MKARKSAALAGAAATLAAATGLLAVPAFASGASATHTLHFTARSVATHNFGRTGGLEVDKDTHSGKVVAYDIIDFVSANGADVSLALKDASSTAVSPSARRASLRAGSPAAALLTRVTGAPSRATRARTPRSL